MSVRETTIRKYNKSQDAHSKGNLLYKSWPAGDTGKTDTEALSIIFSCRDPGPPGEGPGDRDYPGVGTDRGPAGMLTS